MAYALSNNTTATLSSFFALQDDMGKLQQQLATGKSINDPSDNMAIYFKAQSFQTKADNLDVTNANLDLALQHLKLTNASISNMVTNLNAARSGLVDALSKPATTGGYAVSNFGATGNATSGAKQYSVAAATTASGTQLTANAEQKGVIVGSAADKDNSSLFQVGDTFAVTITDASNSTTITRYFKAAAATVTAASSAQTDPDAANTLLKTNLASIATNNATTKGDNTTNAFQFYDLAGLTTAIQQAFNAAGVTAQNATDGKPSATPPVASTYYALQLSLGSQNQSLSFAQVVGQQNDTTGGIKAAAFDFSQLMGSTQTAVNAYGGGVQTSSITLSSLVGAAAQVPTANNAQANQNASTTTAYTYSPVAGTSNPTGVAARSIAATQLATTLQGIDNLLNSGGLPGFVNLFSGSPMTLNVNEDGSQTFSVNLGLATTVTSLGFAGYNASTGMITATGLQGNGFNQNTNIQSAINSIDAALTKLNSLSAQITGGSASLASRLDFNKLVSNALKAGVTAMTSANTAEVSANLTNMQNAGTLLLAAMAKNGQVDQSISRLF